MSQNKLWEQKKVSSETNSNQRKHDKTGKFIKPSKEKGPSKPIKLSKPRKQIMMDEIEIKQGSLVNLVNQVNLAN